VVQLLRLLAPFIVWLYPIGILILLIYLRGWLLASRDLRASLFTLERETAVQRMRRSATGAFCVFGALVGLFVAQFYLGRSLDLNELIRPTPTPGFIIPEVPTVTPATPSPTVDVRTPSPTARPTATRRPTLEAVIPTVAPLPTATPAPPANCPTPGVQITQPGSGATVSGRVDIRGTANIPNFSFYKVEIGLGDHPSRWTSISDLHHTPVTDGFLDVLDASSLPAGTYSLRLVVVDITGNFPPPCEIQIVVAH
jgi:hypothetical protein